MTYPTLPRRLATRALAMAALAAAAFVTAGPVRAQMPTTAPSGMNPTTMAPTTGPAAGGKMIDNPQYALWAKYKPGSSATLTGDIDSQMGKIHVEMTQTLSSITADKATVSSAETVTVMGQSRTMPAQTHDVDAKEAKEEATQTGTKDVTAMGKTFPCKVFEETVKGGMGGGGKITAYVNADVPGGVVQMDVPAPGGKTGSLVMTAMDAK